MWLATLSLAFKASISPLLGLAIKIPSTLQEENDETAILSLLSVEACISITQSKHRTAWKHGTIAHLSPYHTLSTDGIRTSIQDALQSIVAEVTTFDSFLFHFMVSVILGFSSSIIFVFCIKTELILTVQRITRNCWVN